MAPTNEAVEVPRPLPAARRHEFTEDYFRDDMAVFEVNHLPGVRVFSVTEPAARSRALFSVFLNISSSPVLESSNPYFSVKKEMAKTRAKTRSPCLI